MKIKPLNNKVAVKFVEKEEEKTESGIVLPDTAKKDEKPQQGEIVAVGDDCCNDDGEPVINVGDLVVFDKYAGTKVELEGVDYVIISLDDVLAVIE
ncbi:MAG: co-chaperone GroES [Halothermotrichaceae bacterium]